MEVQEERKHPRERRAHHRHVADGVSTRDGLKHVEVDRMPHDDLRRVRCVERWADHPMRNSQTLGRGIRKQLNAHTSVAALLAAVQYFTHYGCASSNHRRRSGDLLLVGSARRVPRRPRVLCVLLMTFTLQSSVLPTPVPTLAPHDSDNLTQIFSQPLNTPALVNMPLLPW